LRKFILKQLLLTEVQHASRVTKEKQITIIKITIYRLAQGIIRHYRKLQGVCNTSTRRL